MNKHFNLVADCSFVLISWNEYELSKIKDI